MNHPSPPSLRLPPSPRPSAGFTLVELMVTVVILAILAVVALPAYRQYVTKSRRSDAYTALANVQQAQERWRANRPSYAPGLTDLGLPSNADAKHYDISIQNASPSGYTLTATPRAGGLQVVDTECSNLSITMTRGTARYAASDAGSGDQSAKCWPK